MGTPSLRLFPRKQLDIRWRDLVVAFYRCVFPVPRPVSEAMVRQSFARGEPLHIAFSVRSCFDLCLQALALPRGSEIIMSALTIREMADIARKHGLVPVPLDLNLATLSPEISDFAAAITPRTRALVLAHLFGSRISMDPFIHLAKRMGIFVFEDCAQAFTGPDYTGHPETDAAMFSFGSIKTATAMGGALLRLRSPQLLQIIGSIQDCYPVQSRREYFREVFTHLCVKTFTLPFLFGIFYRACAAMGKDFERVISAVRNLPEGEEDFSVIRKQPSSPLVSLLARRFRTFDSRQMAARAKIGAEFARSLPTSFFQPGQRAPFNSYWVFPVLAEAPERLAVALRRRGFDATAAGSALSVIESPPGAIGHGPKNLRDAFRRLLYLPVYPEVPARSRGRLLTALRELETDAPHLQVTDACRVYSARMRTIESPRTVSEILAILEQAEKSNVLVCSIGTCHNLGSHAFVDGAVGLDLAKFNRILAIDRERKRITVESGITWAKIQEAISPVGLALQAMQSDNVFSVGGSLSANAHGRDLHASNLIQSVLGFRILLADGSIASASRAENYELFRLVIGGYGLFGVILEVELALEEDQVFEQHSRTVRMGDLPEHLTRAILGDPAARFFMARPSIAPGCFLEDNLVTVWKRSDARPRNVFRLGCERNVRRDKFLVGLSRKYDWGKTLRWHMEKYLSLHASQGSIVSRNNAMRPPVTSVKMLEYYSRRDTDTLQEFFIPIPHFAEFMAGLRVIMRESGTNLLGVTIRYVKADAETCLSYAPREDALAAILWFNESLSVAGRAKAGELIQRLVRLALEHKGTFYLTYVRDLDTGDLRRAYPNIDLFFQAKRRFDPKIRFSNRFFQHYAGPALASRAVSGG